MNLLALLGTQLMGRLSQDRHGRIHFGYDEAWRGSADAMPLSLSLPLSSPNHDSRIVEAVLWGLLPDNEATLQRWASRFHVSARNPAALLSHVGEDCAGAVQFVTEQRYEQLISGGADEIEPLDDHDIADRLKRLRTDASAGRRPDDVGQFSLAGAQPKIALLRTESGWAIPAGRIPTTHILKPPSNDFDGFVENELLCLRLANALGFPAAHAQAQRFEEEIAICVQRYDRIRAGGAWQRIHQEDFCQALGVFPQNKYQNQGGPGPTAMADLLWRHSSHARDDVQTLFRALVFNYLIGGTDAHAKNYSVLIGAGGNSRLAPLYDISSALPYPGILKRKMKMAMRIGSHYRYWDVRPVDWAGIAKDLRLDIEWAFEELAAMAAVLPEVASAVAGELRSEHIEHPILDALVDEIATSCQRALQKLAVLAGPSDDPD